MEFNVHYYSKCDSAIRKYVIYKFLIHNNIANISSSKIKNVDQFILATNNAKKLRLGEKKYLSKLNKNLKITSFV
jgi:hypothetical protein